MNINKNSIAIFLFLGFLILYYLGSFSKVPFGDCMGFITDIEKEKFIFSTSVYAHFLFSNSLILIKKAFPFIDSIEIGRWFTIFFGAISISILYKISYALTHNIWSSFCGSVIFGLSFTFWRNSEIVEIYTFNVFFIALYILYSLKYIQEKQDKFLILSSIILGISLWNHIQNILMIPSFFYLLYQSKNKKLILKSFSIFSILFLSLFLIPLINNEPLSIVFKSTSNHNINFGNLPKDILKAISFLIYNFWHFTILGILGIIILLKKQFTFALFLALIMLPAFGFAMLFNVSDNYVFFLPFNLSYSIFITFSLYYSRHKKTTKWLSFSFILIPLFYFLSYKFISRTERGNIFDTEKKYKGGIKYYALPWLTNNIGILEITIEKKQTPEPIDWMRNSAKEYVKLRLQKNETLENLKNK